MIRHSEKNIYSRQFKCFALSLLKNCLIGKNTHQNTFLCGEKAKLQVKYLWLAMSRILWVKITIHEVAYLSSDHPYGLRQYFTQQAVFNKAVRKIVLRLQEASLRVCWWVNKWFLSVASNPRIGMLSSAIVLVVRDTNRITVKFSLWLILSFSQSPFHSYLVAFFSIVTLYSHSLSLVLGSVSGRINQSMGGNPFLNFC